MVLVLRVAAKPEGKAGYSQLIGLNLSKAY